jgi:hypothetical protein
MDLAAFDREIHAFDDLDVAGGRVQVFDNK